MSHFSIYVVVPQEIFKKGDDAVNAFISNRMERFDESKDVPEYKSKCYCVGRKARNDAESQMIKEMGTWDEARNKAIKKDKNGRKLSRQREQKIWEENFYKPRTSRVNELIDKHPLKDKPDKSCTSCKGTGQEKTKYNPNSKWDWYVVGGRWDGEMVGNYQSSENGFNFGEKHHMLNNNSVQIKDLKKRKSPFAFIDRKGEWHEHGSMGWFGMVSDEKDNWTKVFRKLLAMEKPTDFLVSLDAHI